MLKEACLTGRRRAYQFDLLKGLKGLAGMRYRFWFGGWLVYLSVSWAAAQPIGQGQPLATSAKPMAELRVGFYDLPPHSFYESGGACQDFLEQSILAPLGYRARWIRLPFKRLLLWLENDQIDLAVLVAKTADREGLMQFSKRRILRAQPAFIVRQDHPLKVVRKLAELRGMTVGHAASSIQPMYLHEQGIHFSVVSGTADFPQNVRRLQAGRIEAIFAPTASHAQFRLQQMQLTSALRLLLLPVEGIDLHFAFSPRFPKDLKALFDQQHAKVAADYEKFLASYQQGSHKAQKRPPLKGP